MRRFASALAILALVWLSAGCADSQGRATLLADAVEAPEILGVEIDDQPVDFPQATRVSCEADTTGSYKFVWTSSTYVVLRHPLYQDASSTQIRMSFQADPPVVSSASVQVHVHHGLLNLAWSDEPPAELPALTLLPAGARGYTLVGTLAELGSVATPHFVRVEFEC